MPQIKRYPNRKLYDTAAKRYVTLDELATQIQEGADVHVVDHESGEDLTNVTLTQIVLEQQKKSSSFLSRSLLTDLIRSGGDTLEHLRKSVQNGVAGLTHLPVNGTQEIEDQLDKLMEQGKQAVEQAQEVLQIDNRMADLLHMLNVPSRNEVQALQKQLDDLNQKLASLVEPRIPSVRRGNSELLLKAKPRISGRARLG